MSGEAYARLFREAAKREVHIELPSASKARNLRRMLYAYRTNRISDPELGVLAATVQLRVIGRNLIAGPGASLDQPYSKVLDTVLLPPEPSPEPPDAE